jgi:prephenate dehydratase
MEQQPVSVGIQGNIGSFNEQACRLYCQDHAISPYKIVYLYTTYKVLQHLTDGLIEFGIFAITNNISGVMIESLEAVAAHNFHALDVFDMPVSYALLAKQGTSLSDVTEIISHPSILEGCTRTLQEKYADKKVSAGQGILIDQSTAASHLAEAGSQRSVAVIAPKACAQIYNLAILDEHLEDRESFTTFVWCKKR